MSVKVKDYEFKSSGVSVKIRKVSPLLGQKVAEAFPPPNPPVQKVMYGDEEKYEPNPSNPEYLKALKEYTADYERRVQKLLIERGIDLVITEEMQREIAELKAYMKDELGVEPDVRESDKLFYILYIACSSSEDLRDMLNEILSVSQPTEQEIQKSVDSFQSAT